MNPLGALNLVLDNKELKGGVGGSDYVLEVFPFPSRGGAILDLGTEGIPDFVGVNIPSGHPLQLEDVVHFLEFPVELHDPGLIKS